MNLAFGETLVAFLIVLGLAVFMHELGHFLAAKAVGVRVLEFAFGFPPKLFTLFERNGTQYNVCALPIGGYVKLAGMEPGEDAGPDGFNSKPVWKRMLVYFAGPFMNFVLAALVFVGMGVTVGIPDRGPDAGITRVLRHQPAEQAGFRSGDRIVAIDGRRVDMEQLLAQVRASANRRLVITVERNDRMVDLSVTPKASNGRTGQIGVELQAVGEPTYRRVGVLTAIAYGTEATWKWTRDTVGGIGRMFHDAEARKQVGGPVAIARLAGYAFRDGAITFFTFLAAISVNLGVINLLPLLVVDGGHLMLLTIEWVRGRKLQPSLQISFQVVGMVLILLAVALLTVRDISNWAGGKF
ncbi:MAG: RIP metalloprotease RseP [Armatimonadetes bacterium]|jgi:regulator of sigma E protease|nr:RIP metalloprotease RseP [Armatimonadota bacterium]